MNALAKVLHEIQPTSDTSSGPKEAALWKLVADGLEQIATQMKIWCGKCQNLAKLSQGQGETELTTVTTVTKSQHLQLLQLKSVVDNTKAIFKPKSTTVGPSQEQLNNPPALPQQREI